MSILVGDNYLSPEIRKIERVSRKRVTWHVYISLFLLYTNPGVHTLITSQSPCAPHFISSSYFDCATVDENVVTILEKVPFLLYELYAISMFLYICAFHWSMILMGLSLVLMELRKLGQLETFFYNQLYFCPQKKL